MSGERPPLSDLSRAAGILSLYAALHVVGGLRLVYSSEPEPLTPLTTPHENTKAPTLVDTYVYLLLISLVVALTVSLLEIYSQFKDKGSRSRLEEARRAQLRSRLI